MIYDWLEFLPPPNSDYVVTMRIKLSKILKSLGVEYPSTFKNKSIDFYITLEEAGFIGQDILLAIEAFATTFNTWDQKHKDPIFLNVGGSSFGPIFRN